MESFLLESVGLKSGPAASVMKHMAEQYEIEDKEDLKHLTQRDMEDIISNCGLKRVPAGKLLVAWKASFGLKEAAEDDCATMSTEDKHEEISPDLPTGPFPDGKGGEGGPTETTLAATKKPEHQSSEEGFLPGYSNTDGASPTEQNKQSLRLMYFDEAHNDEEGHRSLIVEREKTSELFQNMSGNAILFAVFGTCETSYCYQERHFGMSCRAIHFLVIFCPPVDISVMNHLMILVACPASFVFWHMFRSGTVW